MLELEWTFGHGETDATMTLCKFETDEHHNQNPTQIIKKKAHLFYMNTKPTENN